MATLSIRFCISFVENNSPADLSWTDITDYAAVGITSSNVRILLKITDPNGTTILKNAGYDTNDFSSPDISAGGGTKTGILPVLTSGGNITQGTYQFYCKIKDVILGGAVYTGNKEYDYQYSSPVVSITQSFSCRTSELTSTDSTNYISDSISPTTTTRTHTITKPSGAGANDPGSTSDVTRIIGGGSTPATRLWTGEWRTGISTILYYEMATWDGSTYIKVNDTVTGNETIDVQCEDCINTIQTALSSYFDRFFTALSNDRSEVYELSNNIIKLLSLWQEYENAQRNGEDYAAYCGEMAEILSSEGYDCDGTSDTTQEIVPYGEGTGTCTGNTIIFVTSAPTGGNSGDLAIGEDGSGVAWNVYQNQSGTWILMGNLLVSNAPLLYNNLTDVNNTATTNEEHLMTYQMPANTLDSDDDLVKVVALFQVTGSSSLNMTLRLYFGSEKIAEYNNTKMADGYYMLNSVVNRIGTSSQEYEGLIKIMGTPCSELGFTYDAASEDLTAIVNIKASCQKGTVGVPGDITCKYLRVQKISKG